MGSDLRPRCLIRWAMIYLVSSPSGMKSCHLLCYNLFWVEYLLNWMEMNHYLFRMALMWFYNFRIVNKWGFTSARNSAFNLSKPCSRSTTPYLMDSFSTLLVIHRNKTNQNIKCTVCTGIYVCAQSTDLYLVNKYLPLRYMLRVTAPSLFFFFFMCASQPRNRIQISTLFLSERWHFLFAK